MRIHKLLLPVLVIALLLGTIAFARATGYWQTTGRRAVSVQQGISSTDIKGWMTLRDLSQGTEIPVEELLVLLGIPADVAETTPLKDLEHIISVGQVRAIIADYTGD